MCSPPRRIALSLAALLGAGHLAAQEATNRDQSQYTELRPEGFPIREGLAIVAAADAKLLDDDLVIGVELRGEARAYPVNLMWEPENEVLNDTLGGKPISATWCPIAHSAAVYDRSLDGRRLDLGAVGLREGVFILYDRVTHSWWSQIKGTALQGPLAGQTLEKHASTLTTWAAWRSVYPWTTVWTDPRLPGRRRFTQESLSRITLAGEGPIVNEDLVVGVEGPCGARAYLLRQLAVAGRVANDTLDGVPIAVVLAEDAVSVFVWSRRLGELNLTFTATDAFLRDLETGSSWDPRTGGAILGPLAGRGLGAVLHTSALWYAWRSQHPDTTLWNP
jgi:hypothetical protein